jgi:hypothetical protein
VIAAAPVQVAIKVADVRGRFNFLPATRKSSRFFNLLDAYNPIKIREKRYNPNKMVNVFIFLHLLLLLLRERTRTGTKGCSLLTG